MTGSPTDDPRRQLWRAGSYEIVGDWFRDASLSVLDGLALDGVRLLDLATGTGAVAIEAARRGADVVGVDLTPELLDVAGRRAALAGVDVEWVHDDFDGFTSVPEHIDAFDVVASSFGVMFAPDPRATAQAMAAVTAPGGVVTICSWSTTGLFGVDWSPELVALMPPTPPEAFARPWSSADGVAALFAESGAVLAEHVDRSIGVDFESIDDTLDQFERWSGPWQGLFAHFRESGTLDVARRLLAADFSRFLVPSNAGITLTGHYARSLLRREHHFGC